MGPQYECRQSGSKNWVTKRPWEELAGGGGGGGIKLERKVGARRAEHVKDSEQKSVQIQGS